MNIKDKINAYETIYVHSGTFHSDDLLSVSFMQMLNPDIKVKRISEVTNSIYSEAEKGKALICDIGGIYNPELNMFDHHQKDDTVLSEKPSWDKTNSKNHHSAFGLLWKNYGDYFCEKFGYSEKTKEKFYDFFVSQIDAVDNGERKNAETQFPNLVKSLFNPNTWILSKNDENSIYNKTFMESIDYGKQCIEKHFKDINLYLNQGKEEYEINVKDFVKTRNKTAIDKVYKISKNPRYHLPNPSEAMKTFACEILNINKTDQKLVSEISSFNSKVTKGIDAKEMSKAIEQLELSKMLSGLSLENTSGILKTKRKVSVTNVKEIFSKAHWLDNTSETRPVEVVHRFELKNRNALIAREENMIDYALSKNTNFFVYDGNSNRYFSPTFSYSSSLDDVMEKGGYLYIRQPRDNSQASSNLEKMKETIKSGKYVKTTGEIINVSKKTYVFVESERNTNNPFERQKELRKFEPKLSENFNKIDIPFAISYKQRNGQALKFCVDIGENLYKFKDISSISNTLFITDKTKVDTFGAIALLTSKHYYDKIKIDGVEFDLKKATETMLNKTNVYEAIKEPQTLQKVLETCKVSQFINLKERFEKDKNLNEIQKALIDSKEAQLVEKIKVEAKMESLPNNDLKTVANLCKDKSYTAFETNLVYNGFETKIKLSKGYTNLTFEKDDEIIKSKDFINAEDFFDFDDDYDAFE